MTAQGEDLLAWLDRAITAREQAANAASGSTWRADDWGNVQTDQHETVAEVWPLSGAQPDSNVTFIAANDPQSVLRRCAADQKLLALHGRKCHSCPATDETGYLDEWTQFDYGDMCPVVQLLAEGYGWAEGER
ncbi:DUF6221 family protein [Streptomyces violaceoruber]|uniref:DUF6221 family protein n=1 Tax=Streptomyces violaceoruber TaxID=1935 RepID=UPI00403C21CD